MRHDSFASSVLFAALAAAGWLPWILLIGPIIGSEAARAFYLIGLSVLYVAIVSPRRRLTFVAAVGVIATTLAFVAHSTVELCISLAVLIGIVRSALLYRAKAARAVVTEMALLLGGLLFARHLAGPSLLSTAFAIWAFFLVQSVFFLIGGVRPQRSVGTHPDPFEEAYRRAVVLLERTEI